MRLFVALLAVAGCGTLKRTPAATPIAREPVTIYATATATFDAAVSSAATVAPIKHTDRAGGVIVLEMARLTPDDSRRYADCGRMAGNAIVADIGNITITLREQGGLTALQATALYAISPYRNPNPPRCVSTGALESALESAIKQRAEAR